MKLLKILLGLFILSIPNHIQSQALYPDGIIAWRSDGSMLAIGRGSTVEIVEVSNMNVLNTISNFINFTTYRGEIVWSPDGNKLAITNGADVEVWQNPWDSMNSHLLTVYQYYSEFSPPVPDVYVEAIAWSSDSEMIASAAGIGIDIWQASNGDKLRVIISEGLEVYDLDWSVDNRLAVADLDNFVTLYNPVTGDFLNAFYTEPPPSLPSGVWSIAFSPDDRQMVVGLGNGQIRIWGTQKRLTKLLKKQD